MKKIITAILILASVTSFAQTEKKNKWSQVNGPHYAVGGSFMATGTAIIGYALYQDHLYKRSTDDKAKAVLLNERNFYGMAGGAMIGIGSFVFITTLNNIGHKNVSASIGPSSIRLTIKI
ncbi:MAG: hypothetical protein L6Q66_07770 [Bacteroidia bacterium]|nr:hypothetical protein [Bacteroidia bacterium]